jgi:nucleoside-diphosphate-sugar epimerase
MWAPEDKVRIVLESLNTNISLNELCRKYDLRGPRKASIGIVGNMSLTEKKLGWKARINLEDGLKSTYGWAESQLVTPKLTG